MNSSEFVHEQSPIPFEERTCKEFIFPRRFRPRGVSNIPPVSQHDGGKFGLRGFVDQPRSGQAKGYSTRRQQCLHPLLRKEAGEVLPQARVSRLLFQAPDRVHIMDSKDLEGGLLQNAEQAELFLLGHLPVRFEIKGMDRINHYEIPIEVLREGIINSLMHRNYAVRGGNLSIEIFPNQVSIVNPGGLPAALSPKDFGTMSIRRNQLIADIFHRAGKVERAGSGINRIRSGLAKAKCPAPEFKFSSSFELVLYRRFADTDQFQPITTAGEETDATHDRAILKFCLIPRSAKEIAAKLGVRKRESAIRRLKPLIQKSCSH